MSPEPLLYYSPGACSLAAHIALREAGYAPRLELVSTRDGSTNTAEHLERNPLGQVPVLELPSGRRLTEVAAILTWAAHTRPEAELLPAEPEAVARAYEWMSFLSSYVHRAFWLYFRPYAATDDKAAQATVSAKGKASFAAALEQVEARLPEGGWALGERYCVVDAHALVYAYWGVRASVLGPLPRLRSWAQRMLLRPAVIETIAAEGLGQRLNAAAFD